MVCLGFTNGIPSVFEPRFRQWFGTQPVLLAARVPRFDLLTMRARFCLPINPDST